MDQPQVKRNALTSHSRRSPAMAQPSAVPAAVRGRPATGWHSGDACRAIRSASSTLACLTLLLPAAAGGQVVRGSVLAEGTRTPLADVQVTLLIDAPDALPAADSVVATTNERGQFQLRAPHPGRYRIRAGRLGYVVTLTPPFAVPPGQEVTVTVLLGLDAIPLEPLRVEATAMLPLVWEQIEERRRLGFGRYITRADIERRPGALSVAELIDELPGVRVAPTGHGDQVVQIRARTRLEIGLLGPEYERENAFLAASACPVTLYVDGVKWSRDYDFKGGTLLDVRYQMSLNEEFMNTSAADIEIIEVYSGAASMPGVFGGPDAECGVIAVWLRRGGDRHARDPDSGPARFFRGSIDVAATGARLSGEHAPAPGVGAMALLQVPAWRALHVGVFVRRARHRLDAATVDGLTRSLGRTEPASELPLTMVQAGLQPRLVLRRDAALRPVVAARVLLARRAFNPYAAAGARSARSTGVGYGVDAGAELQLDRRVAACAGLGYDRLSFEGFGGLDRADHRTAAVWRATALHAGLIYSFPSRPR
jgi:hypothetical protein